MFPELSRAIKRFNEEMASVDEVVHILLKGHLLIEETLTRVLEQYLFHREHLSEARLTFNQKVLLGRALCLRKNDLGTWELISAINSLRNEIAHRLNSPERERKLSKVKEIYLREVADAEESEKLMNGSDPFILHNACALCVGFLAKFENDSKALRQKIHLLDRELNPDLPEFEL